MRRSYLILGNPLLFTFGEQGGEGSDEPLLPGGLRSEQQGAPDPVIAYLSWDSIA